ncbi:MAG: GTPase Era [Burkholderiales bacterium]
MNDSDISLYRCGLVAIVGRPNVGKSTLINRLVGTKISITSNRPQTTRHRITGVVSSVDAQIVLVDTPGFQMAHGGALNKIMNHTVTDSLAGTDVVLFMVEALKFGPEDSRVVALLPDAIPVVLVINKVDKVREKSRLLPFIEKVSQTFAFTAVVPVSAAKGSQTDRLIEVLKSHLPLAPAMFDDDTLTDRSERFLAAEFLREKLFRLLGEELPYAATVVVEAFELRGEVRHIQASIVVAKENHKAMVIGAKGEKLKAIASQARVDMEKLFGGKVFLEVWVRVKSGWSENLKTLKSLGYE